MGVGEETLPATEQGSSTDGTPAPGPRRRSWGPRVVLLVSTAIVAVVAWQAWGEVVAAFGVLRTMALPMLGLALVLQALAVLTLPQVYRTAAASLGARLGYAQSLQVSMGAFTLSRVLPGGGAAGAVWAARRLQRFDVPWATAGTAVVLEGVLAMATLGLIVAAGTVAALVRGHVTTASVVAAIAVAGAFVLLGWACMALLESTRARAATFAFVGRVVPPVRPRLRDWDEALEELRRELPGIRELAPVVAWSAVNWGAEIAALWTVFAGLGISMELGVLVVGYGVANLVTALPHTPGGLGLVEAGMTGAYVALGTETAVALAGVLAYRLIAFWLPVLVGVPQYLRAPVAARGAR